MIDSRHIKIGFTIVLLVATYIATFVGFRYFLIHILHFPGELVIALLSITFAIIIPVGVYSYSKSVRRFYRGEEVNVEFNLARIFSPKYGRFIFWFFGLLIIPVFAMIYGLVFSFGEKGTRKRGRWFPSNLQTLLESRTPL